MTKLTVETDNKLKRLQEKLKSLAEITFEYKGE